MDRGEPYAQPNFPNSAVKRFFHLHSSGNFAGAGEQHRADFCSLSADNRDSKDHSTLLRLTSSFSSRQFNAQRIFYVQLDSPTNFLYKMARGVTRTTQSEWRWLPIQLLCDSDHTTTDTGNGWQGAGNGTGRAGRWFMHWLSKPVGD